MCKNLSMSNVKKCGAEIVGYYKNISVPHIYVNVCVCVQVSSFVSWRVNGVCYGENCYLC